MAAILKTGNDEKQPDGTNGHFELAIDPKGPPLMETAMHLFTAATAEPFGHQTIIRLLHDAFGFHAQALSIDYSLCRLTRIN
jgi:hypothetical protein